MSGTSIPEKVRVLLWVKAGGRCEYEGCNDTLWRDELTMADMNRAYIAHIIADSPEGPRGDKVLSSKLAADISNLMLLCDTHHRIVDREQLAEHPTERLLDMKRLHESRIELLTSISPDKKSEIILYGANIGQHSSPISYQKSIEAMIPHRYPIHFGGIMLAMINSSYTDIEEEFWRYESDNLKRLYSERVVPQLQSGNIDHLSIFAIAPQPLLVYLGSLLSDIPAAEVYQLHREPPDWKWQDHPEGFDYIVKPPNSILTSVALNLSLSATIDNSRILSVLGDDTSIWTITIDNPNNDCLKSSRQLSMFRELLRKVFDWIKAKHGEDNLMHVFPAVPVSVAVEIGRVWMPKADLPLKIYDQNRRNGGFTAVLDIGT